jgi:hypothetical protein
MVPLAGVSEASGLALSRRVPGRLWTHNDSGAPVLFALDANGAVTGRVQITGAPVQDWEAIAVGPCAAQSCVYVADIGDNGAARKQVTIYRVPEPEAASGSAAAADVFHAAYPDGAHDAEAMLVSRDGQVHLVTKGETGPIALYRLPKDARAGSRVTLQRVGAPAAAKGAAASHITDGSVSADGEWVVLRTKTSLEFHRASELFSGKWEPAGRVDLTFLKEPQGEGIAMGAGNTVFLAGEGGGGKPQRRHVRPPGVWGERALTGYRLQVTGCSLW